MLGVLTYGQEETSINGVDVIIHWSYDLEAPCTSAYIERIIPRSPDANLWDILTKEQQNKLIQRIQNLAQEETINKEGN
jgi:hypothetical protein